MSKFKMQSPYKWDPISIHEVPFDDPNLMGKANKNGTIIMNKDQARNPEMREKIKIHEKHHLNDMLIEKNADGTPKLDYDADSVTYKGTEYNRESFDEGNKGLPWEESAYKAKEDIDFSGGKLKSAGPNMIGAKTGRSDEDEVSMGESFGPANRRTFMQEPRGKSNPFKFMQDQGLLGDHVTDGIDGGPSGYAKPKAVKNAPPIDVGQWVEGAGDIAKDLAGKGGNKDGSTDEEVIEPDTKDDTDLITPNMYGPGMNGPAEKCPPGPEGDACREAQALAQKNMDESAWTYNPETDKEERKGEGSITIPGETNVKTDVIPKAKTTPNLTTDKDKYIESLRSRFPNSTRQDLIDGGYVSSSWDGDWTDPTPVEDKVVTQNVFEERDKVIPTENGGGGGGNGGGGNGNSDEEKVKRKPNSKLKEWWIGRRKKPKGGGRRKKGNQYSCKSGTSCSFTGKKYKGFKNW